MKTRKPPENHNFFYRSFYQLITLQDPTQSTPERYNSILTFKIYQQGRRIPLFACPAPEIGDARQAFQAFQANDQIVPSREALEDARLSTLLYYIYGFSRYDRGPTWPFHRFVASARCLFPTELYLCLPPGPLQAAGLYHYDPLHHSLTCLREGDYFAYLAELLGTNLDGSVGVLLISTLFGKTAAIYKDFAYRLCTQEAGLVAGNALLVAAAMGLQGKVHYRFLDYSANHLCGLIESDEALLACVVLSPLNHPGQGRSKAEDTPHLAKAPAPLNLSYLRQGLPEPENYATLLAFHRQTCLSTLAELQVRPTFKHSACDAAQKRLPFPPQIPTHAELAEALRRRHSGDLDFVCQSKSMSQAVFSDIIRYALQPYASDLYAPADLPTCRLFVVVNNVDALEPGIYSLCSACSMLHVVSIGEQKQHLQALQLKNNINAASANLVCFLVSDYMVLHKQLGDRAYRVLNLEAGLIAQRLCVMSSVHGVTARYSNSFDVAAVKKFFHRSESTLTPIAELIIGYERPGAFAGEHYRSSLCC